MRDSDIPHRTSVAKAIHEKAHKVRATLKGLFAVSLFLVFFWESAQTYIYARVSLVRYL
jgi:hypothetical protein